MNENDPIRVLLANDSFPPTIDGVANTVLNYGYGIERGLGHAMVATPRYPDVKDDYPFEVLRYPSLNTQRSFGYRMGLPLSPAAMERVQRFAPDILHCHCPVSSMLFCREARSRLNVPLVFTYHTKFDIDIARAIRLGFLKEAAVRLLVENVEAADEVWAVNHGAAENLKSLGYRGEIRVMLNGVDFPRGAAPEEDIAAVRAQYGIPADRPCFLFVGRMLWYKGQRIILDALRRLKERGAPFYMVFIGDGADLPEMQAEAALSGLQNDVLFTGAIRDRAVLRAFYSLAEMFLLPSVFDNNPIVVKEAAACGTAPVLIRDSSPAEGTADGQNALLIGEDAAEMAQTLLRVCREPALARRLGERAQTELYAPWDEQVAQAVDRYREILRAAEKGELPPRPPVKLDRFFDALADWQLSMERLKGFLSSAFEGNEE